MYNPHSGIGARKKTQKPLGEIRINYMHLIDYRCKIDNVKVKVCMPHVLQFDKSL